MAYIRAAKCSRMTTSSHSKSGYEWSRGPQTHRPWNEGESGTEDGFIRTVHHPHKNKGKYSHTDDTWLTVEQETSKRAVMTHTTQQGMHLRALPVFVMYTHRLSGYFEVSRLSSVLFTVYWKGQDLQYTPLIHQLLLRTPEKQFTR